MVFQEAQLIIRSSQLDELDLWLTGEIFALLFSKSELFLQAEYGVAVSSGTWLCH